MHDDDKILLNFIAIIKRKRNKTKKQKMQTFLHHLLVPSMK